MKAKSSHGQHFVRMTRKKGKKQAEITGGSDVAASEPLFVSWFWHRNSLPNSPHKINFHVIARVRSTRSNLKFVGDFGIASRRLAMTWKYAGRACQSTVDVGDQSVFGVEGEDVAVSLRHCEEAEGRRSNLLAYAISAENKGGRFKKPAFATAVGKNAGVSVQK